MTNPKLLFTGFCARYGQLLDVIKLRFAINNMLIDKELPMILQAIYSGTYRTNSFKISSLANKYNDIFNPLAYGDVLNNIVGKSIALDIQLFSIIDTISVIRYSHILGDDDVFNHGHQYKHDAMSLHAIDMHNLYTKASMCTPQGKLFSVEEIMCKIHDDRERLLQEDKSIREQVSQRILKILSCHLRLLDLYAEQLGIQQTNYFLQYV